MLIFADGLQVRGQLLRELARARYLVVRGRVRAERLLHLRGNVGEDVRIVEALDERVDDFFARGRVQLHVGLLGRPRLLRARGRDGVRVYEHAEREER